MNSSQLNDYMSERDEFYYFMDKIESFIANFDCKDENKSDFERLIYLKVVISDVHFYLERIIKSILNLFKQNEQSFTPVYDIIILTRKNLSDLIETIDLEDSKKYDVEEQIVSTLKTIDNQFSFLFNEANKRLYKHHPIIGQFRSMNLCMLNFLRR